MVGQPGCPAGRLATGDMGEGPSASSSYSSSRLGLVSTQARAWGLLSPGCTRSDREPRFPSACAAETGQLCMGTYRAQSALNGFPSTRSGLGPWLLKASCPPAVSPPSQVDLIAILAALPPSVTLFYGEFSGLKTEQRGIQTKSAPLYLSDTLEIQVKVSFEERVLWLLKV